MIRFGVFVFDRERLTLTREGRPIRLQPQRGLFHLGKFEFCPVVAESVRIKFVKQADAALLTVHDPDVVLTARRV